MKRCKSHTDYEVKCLASFTSCNNDNSHVGSRSRAEASIEYLASHDGVYVRRSRRLTTVSQRRVIWTVCSSTKGPGNYLRRMLRTCSSQYNGPFEVHDGRGTF